MADAIHKTRDDSLQELRTRAIITLRITAFSMYSVPIGMYFLQDRQVLSFFDNVVTPAATLAAVITEIWRSRNTELWKVLAMASSAGAAVLFYFVAAGFFHRFLDLDLAMLVSVIPLAGVMLAWKFLREHAQILR